MPIPKGTASYTIRTGRVEDSESTLDIQKSIVSEGHFLISLPEEFKKTSSEQREWVQGVKHYL